MEEIKDIKVIASDESNRILGSEPSYCENTLIEFNGKNNILYIEGGGQAGQRQDTIFRR